MIDTRRIGREEPLEPNGVFGPLGLPAFTQTGRFADPARQILGAEQEAWLIQRLQASTARWKLLGNQVVFSQLKLLGLPEATGLSLFVNPDQWDGYAAARERLFEAIDGQVSNLVVLTGDVHAAFAMDVSRDPNNPLVYNPLTGSGAVALDGRRVEGPINPDGRYGTDPLYLDLHLPAGAGYAQPLAANYNAFVYVYEGSVRIGSGESARALKTHSTGVLSPGDAVEMTAGAEGARLILLAARPLNEPVVQYGPFEMNTREEIEQALAYYRNGKLAA